MFPTSGANGHSAAAVKAAVAVRPNGLLFHGGAMAPPNPLLMQASSDMMTMSGTTTISDVNYNVKSSSPATGIERNESDAAPSGISPVAETSPRVSEADDKESSSTSVSSDSTSTAKIASLPLHQKLAGDVLVAASVTFCVAPFLTVVDKAIVQTAAGSNSLLGSAWASVSGIARHPVSYFRSPTFGLMWAVYAATYSTANSLKTIVEHFEHREKQQQITAHRPPPTLSATNLGKWAIFAGTTAVNSGASLLKDRAYARMFSSAADAAKAKTVPGVTYACWVSRDILVVGSSFLLPGIFTNQLAQRNPDLDKEEVQKWAQLTLPIATQVIAGPLHFMGLDFYNRDLTGATWSQAVRDRAKALWTGAPSVIAARIARIAPGYGIGGVYNTKYRDMWRTGLVEYTARTEARAPVPLPVQTLATSTASAQA